MKTPLLTHLHAAHDHVASVLKNAPHPGAPDWAPRSGVHRRHTQNTQWVPVLGGHVR